MIIQLEGLEIKEPEEVVSIEEPIGPQIVRKKLSRRWRQRLEEERSYWREVVSEKDKQIRGLEKERNELMGKVYTYRDYANRFFEENEGLKRRLDEAERERERLAMQVSAYFNEKEEEPKEIKFGCRKRRRERKKPGAKQGHKGWYREKPDKVDEVIEERLTECPHCGSSEISECADAAEHTVEDIIPARRKVTLYRKYYYWCSGCRKKVFKKTAAVKNSRLGENAISYAAKFRYGQNLPYEKIADIFKTLCGLKVSESGLAQALERNANKVEVISESIIDKIRHSNAVNGDETGWPVLGEERSAQWLWDFCNKEAVYYHVDKSRGSEVVKNVLGERIDGVLSSDFYSGYNKIEAKKQRCLVHLLRDIKKYLEEAGCDDFILTRIKEGIEELIDEGLELQKDAGTGTAEGVTWQVKRQMLKEKLKGLSRLESEDKNAKKIIKRLNRFEDELLTFVDHPGVEYHNNLAERQLRPLVVSRKISYGSRTERGARTTCIMMSILMTCKIRGIDFGKFLQDAITGRESQSALIRRLLGKSPEASVPPRSPP